MTNEDRALILITNDDGIASPGLLAAVRSVLDLGDVWIVAPRVQQSGSGRSFPNGEPDAQEGILDVQGTSVRFLSLDTSPAKAVRIGLLTFLPRLPDLAISGINYGENVGACVTVSGTIGAAIESATFGIPTLAASLETERRYHFSHSSEVDFSVAAAFVRRLAKLLLARGMPEGVDILKLDVPWDAKPETPWKVTRVSRQQYFVSPVKLDEHGKRHVLDYISEVNLDTLEPDSDVYALAVDKVISVSPLTFDLTAMADFQHVLETLSAEGRRAI